MAKKASKKKVTKKTTKKKTVVKKKPLRRLPTEATLGAGDIVDYITCFYGPPGVGKTTFVNKLADTDVLFISTDRGSRHLKARRQEAFNYEEILEILDALEAPGAPKYEMVCIDHVDDFANMAEEYTLEDLKIDSLSDAKWGKGWKEFRRNINRVVQRLKALNCGIVFIAHEGIRTIRVHGIERDIIQPDMGKTSWKVIIPLTDLVGYCGFRDMKQGGKRVEKRTIQTQPTQSIYAKDRTQRRKPSRDYEMLDGKKFRSTFTGKGVASHGEEGNQEEGNEERSRRGRRGRRPGNRRGACASG